MAFISSACASCAISGIDLLAAGPYSSVLSVSLSLCKPLSLSSSLLSPSFKLLSAPSLSLYLSPSLPLSVSRCFFFWPGRPSQCEIMVNAPWQSDTTHSPGPAPSGFNLIWSEKWGLGGVVECGRGGGEMKGWRTGCLLEGGRVTRWKLGVLFSAESSHHPSFFPNCPLPSSHVALTPPPKSLKW